MTNVHRTLWPLLLSSLLAACGQAGFPAQPSATGQPLTGRGLPGQSPSATGRVHALEQCHGCRDVVAVSQFWVWPSQPVQTSTSDGPLSPVIQSSVIPQPNTPMVPMVGSVIAERDGLVQLQIGDISSGPDVLPLACISATVFERPSALSEVEPGWSRHAVAFTSPLRRTVLETQAARNQYCDRAFGSGWRVLQADRQAVLWAIGSATYDDTVSIFQ